MAEHKNQIYDLVIIGAGAAGLAAAIYASRYKINHLVIGQKVGGLAGWAPLIENYPGYQPLPGQELMKRFLEQAKSLGSNILEGEVIEMKKSRNNFLVTIRNQQKIIGRSLIFATGTERQKLNVPGEDEFWGRGVTYCATCDAPLYKGKIVAVVGGGDSALTSALLLTEYAKKVYLIHRRDQFRGQVVWQERAMANSKIEKVLSTNIIEIKGEEMVQQIVLDKPYQGLSSLEVNGLFVEIGSTPSVYLVKNLGVALDEKQYIIVDNNCRTNLSGVFAAGDVTNQTHLKQILTAASQGAVAAYSCYHYLTKK